jgi:hypothetical protein
MSCSSCFLPNCCQVGGQAPGGDRGAVILQYNWSMLRLLASPPIRLMFSDQPFETLAQIIQIKHIYYTIKVGILFRNRYNTRIDFIYEMINTPCPLPLVVSFNPAPAQNHLSSFPSSCILLSRRYILSLACASSIYIAGMFQFKPLILSNVNIVSFPIFTIL